MAYYANSWSIVRNEDKLFKTTRGSKQGGPLSPTFFSIYGNELSSRLKASSEAIWFENRLINILYADDITLIALITHGIQTLVRILEEYCDEFEIQLNPEKTFHMIILKYE